MDRLYETASAQRGDPRNLGYSPGPEYATADSSVERQTIFGEIVGRNRSQNRRLNGLVNDLEALVQRLTGNGLGGSTEGNAKPVNSVYGEVEETIVERVVLLDRLETVTSQLTTLA